VRKTLSASRQRGGNSYTESRPNTWAATIGFMLGRGYSSVAVADTLKDGTLPATIRAIAIKRWKLPGYGSAGDRWPVVIAMPKKERRDLTLAAAHHGLPIEEYCRRMLICGSMPRDCYRDVVGSTFDQAKG
jgi:hypothetical protein